MHHLSLSLSVWLSIFLLLLVMYIQPLPLFVLLPFHQSVLSLSHPLCLSLALLKLCRQEQRGTKLSQWTSHWLLVDFSFKFIFKQHLFILNSREYISRHYNANDGTHIFLRIVVVGVGVWVRGQRQACMCVTVPNPRLAVALDMRECKDWTSAHTLAWLYLWTKGSLWRTSCVRILGFVGMLERLLRSGDITLGGASSFVVLPSKHYSFCSILSLVSCRLHLLPCCPASLFTPLPPSGLFILSTTDQSAVARSQHPM